MWRLVVIVGSAGLLAACTGPVRGPVPGSAGAPAAGVAGPSPGGQPLLVTSVAPPRKSPKTASSQKDRTAGHPKAPKRIAKGPAVQKTATDTKARRS
jgi:hypothetical protein